MPVVVLAGEEDFELSRRLTALKDGLLGNDPAWKAFNFLKIDRPLLTDVIDNALAVPFGTGNKVILFDNCAFFTKKRGVAKAGKGHSPAKQAKQLDRLDDVLGSVAENTHLIFACPHNFDKSLKLSKILSRHARIEEFPRPRYFVGSHNPKLETWVNREAKRYGATIDEQAISYLLDGTEANLRQISNELEKAATYVTPGTHITYDVVAELSPYHSHVFSLLDHWLGKRAGACLSSIDELLSRQPAVQIIATLQTFLSRWIEMKSILLDAHAKLPHGPGIKKRELPFPEQVKIIAGATRAKPFMVEKDMRRLRDWPLDELIDRKEMLTRLEHSVKTGRLKDRNALELFLTR